MNKFWVDLKKLGLGFAREGNGGEEREKRMKEMRENGFFPHLYARWVGSTQNPVYFLFWPLDSDPDGSGSIQRSWSVSLIRIHQIRGSGPLTRQLLIFFQFLDFFLLFTPSDLAIWTHMHANFLAKILKKLLYVSWWIFNRFVVISYFEVDKKHVR